MKSSVVVVGVLAVVVAVLVGIGITKKNQTSDAVRIGVIPKETASVYWDGVHQGALKAAEEEGIDILWNGPEIETDRERQIQICEDFMAQKVAGIVLAPNDRKALVPVVERIHGAGIPIVVVDSSVDTDKYLSYMATDNLQGGVMAARRIGKILDGKGKVILVAWTPNSGSTDARCEGFTKTLKEEFPGIELVDTKYPNPATVAKAREVTEDMLTRNKDVDALFACNATTAAGALQALRSPGQADRKIKMVGFDSWDSLVAGLQADEIDSLVIQDPFKMGYEGVKAILKKRAGDTNIVRHVDTGVELVTKDRLGEPKIKQLLNLK